MQLHDDLLLLTAKSLYAIIKTKKEVRYAVCMLPEMFHLRQSQGLS